MKKLNKIILLFLLSTGVFAINETVASNYCRSMPLKKNYNSACVDSSGWVKINSANGQLSHVNGSAYECGQTGCYQQPNSNNQPSLVINGGGYTVCTGFGFGSGKLSRAACAFAYTVASDVGAKGK